MNSITPPLSKYVPSPGTLTSLTSFPALSTNVRVDLSRSTFSCPLLKFTVVLSWSGVSNTTGDFWTAPRAPSVSDTSPVGVTGVTVGVYLTVTGVPFLSTRLTVTPVPVPVNPFSGVNVTVPSGFTLYVPSPGTTFSVNPSSNVAGTSSSIGTSGLPGLNVGFPVCSLPWISVVSFGSAVGVTGVTVGV